ncbi:MAG: ribonuclease HII [Bacteroidetes bacterium]|nr:MAG: ribonuclease HII [Bacteroidota bacterium]
MKNKTERAPNGSGLAPFYQKGGLEAGCDEAGRGCLAGPVCAAAVILPPGFYHPLLNDSKKLTERQRHQLRPVIEREAIAWGVAFCSPAEIDRINILNASFLAMHRALDQLATRPTSLLIDGNRFKPYAGLPHYCMVKGDGRFMSIAAASVLAKTWRDRRMLTLAKDFPQYDWANNKGYPTKKHREAIRTVGPSPHHRRSFKWLPDGVQGQFDF